MNKEELITELSRKTRFTRRDTEMMVNGVFDTISSTLENGEKVQIPVFGTFEVKERAPRTGRNPKANVPVHIPAKKVPYFTPSKALKSIIEQTMEV